jgi:hypothetical protein
MKQEYNAETLGTRGRMRGNRKWDTAKIEALYMAGAELGDILKTPEFEKMSKNYLKNLMVQGKWIAKRIKLREEVANTLAPKMEDVMRRETENHYNFMLQQISEERKQIEIRNKSGNIKDQSARLDVLAQYEKMATRALGLDENNLHDRKGLNINAMISLHVEGPKKAVEIDIVPMECSAPVEGQIEPVERQQ